MPLLTIISDSGAPVRPCVSAQAFVYATGRFKLLLIAYLFMINLHTYSFSYDLRFLIYKKKTLLNSKICCFFQPFYVYHLILLKKKIEKIYHIFFLFLSYLVYVNVCVIHNNDDNYPNPRQIDVHCEFPASPIYQSIQLSIYYSNYLFIYYISI